MAKGYAAKVAKKVASGNVGENGHHKTLEHETSTGFKLKIVGISHLYFEEVRNSVKFPDKPMYTVEIPGGTEKHVIDQTVVDDPTNTPEEKLEYARLLAQYTEDYQAAERLQANRVNDFLLLRGVVIQSTNADVDEKEWLEEREVLGLPTATTGVGRRLQYLKNRVIGSIEDYEQVLEKIMQVTGVGEDSVAELRDLFRGGVEKEETAV